MLLTVDRYGKDNDYGMLKHQFGIMMTDPAPEQIFEEYEPEKYDCIAVDDEYVQEVAEMLAGVSVYWHGLDRPESGLAYHGITLIPPESIEKVIEAVKDVPEMRRLMEMLVVAERERKFVIHFGV